MKVGHDKVGVVKANGEAREKAATKPAKNTELARTTPVRPPRAKSLRKQTAQSRGTPSLRRPPHIVAIQLLSFRPVGTAMIIVAAVK
jgi:hypothetical protein